MSIKNIRDLAREVGAQRDGSEGETNEEISKSIARRLYKDTTCGISFWSDAEGVVCTGYCEGSDWLIDGHGLNYPFISDEFWAAVKAADADGCKTWDETHGCETCGPEDEHGVIPVNSECKGCGGQGVVI